MSTAMLNQSRPFLKPSKRKDREGFDPLQPSSPQKLAKPSVVSRSGSSSPRASEPARGNQLLAGCLAHEFLTKGTLLGQPWDPARAEAVPVSAESRKMKPSGQNVQAEPKAEKLNRYAEVADILKTSGAHLPDIVNPTQLGRFLQL